MTNIRAIARWVNKSCDIVALQESWCRHSEWKSAFSQYGWSCVFPSREAHITGFFGSGLAFAYRMSDWELQDSRFYPFLATIGVDQLTVKGWFRIEAYHRRTGKLMRFLNTHMQSDYEIYDELWRQLSEPIRIAQAVQITDVERRMPRLPTLMLGDFNTETCWLPGCHFLSMNGAPTFPRTQEMLDHCAVWNHHDWILINHHVDCVQLSDHYPSVWTVKNRGIR